MKSGLLILLMIASLGSAWSESDAVDRLVTRLSGTHGLWVNGLSPTLGLPATASTPEVVAKVLSMVGFAQGQVRTHKIMSVREVTIEGSGNSNYKAVVVDTDLGQKIILLQFEKSSGWWSRVFDGSE